MKVGDMVRCIEAEASSDLTLGDSYVIQGTSKDNTNRFFIMIDDKGKERKFFTNRFAPLSGSTSREWDEYSFEIRSMVQLDTHIIKKDLSADDPMMLIEFTGSKLVQVIIHDSIWDKACNSGEHWTEDDCGFEFERYRFFERLTMGLGYNGMIRKDIHLASLIQLVKDIKAAKWEKPFKSTVTVRRITI